MSVVTSRAKRNQRTLVNNPATSASERVLIEKDLGNGSYMRRAYIEEVLVMGGAGAVSFTTALPANCRVIHASMNYDTALTLTTAVKMGIGTAASPSLFGLSTTAVTKNLKTDTQPLEASAIVTASVTPRVSACATGGTAAGTAVGTVRGRIVYEYFTSIASQA